MNKSRLLGAVCTCVLLFPLTVNAIGLSEADLKGRLAFELPRTWEVSEFKVTLSQNMGSESSPLVKSRFDAKIKAKEDFYRHSRWEDGGTEVIEAIAKKGDELPLYGDATSTMAGSIWDVKFQFERKVHEEGKNRASFSSNAIVLGSDAEKEIIAHRNAEKTKVAKKNAEVEAARRAKADELAKAKISAQAKQRANQEAASQEQAQREVRYQQLLAKFNPKANPDRLSGRLDGSPALSQYPLRAGDVYYFELDNPKNYEAHGGDPYYTTYTYLEGAAIHAGILGPKDKGIIKVTVVSHGGSLLGVPKNGVKSSNVPNVRGGKALLIQAVHDNDYNMVQSRAPVTATTVAYPAQGVAEAVNITTDNLVKGLRNLLGSQ